MTAAPVTWQTVDWSTVSWEAATTELEAALIDIELLAGRMATLAHEWCKPEGRYFVGMQVGAINLQLMRAQTARVRLREFEAAMQQAQEEPLQ